MEKISSQQHFKIFYGETLAQAQQNFQRELQRLAADVGKISLTPDFIPYLSLTENLLMGFPNKFYKQKITELPLAKELQVSDVLLNKEPESLTQVEMIQLQIFRALLAENKILCLEDIVTALTIPERQQLFSLFRDLIEKEDLVIYLLTTDETLVDNLKQVDL